MSEPNSIRVNFGRPMPLFPLNTVGLMPHGVLPLHVFEPRYRQMVSDSLDGSGQISMAVFEGDEWRENYHGRPAIRPFVCIGQIVQHHKLPDGRYNIAIQGVCRARVLEEVPAEADVQYRLASLEPIGIGAFDEHSLETFRHVLRSMLCTEPLNDLTDAELILQHVDDTEIPSSVILELLALTILTDSETRYALLSEGDPIRRAHLIEQELSSIGSLIRRAGPQRQIDDLPRGCSWN